MKKFKAGAYKSYVGTHEIIYCVEKTTEKTVTIAIHKGGKYEKTKRCKIVDNGINQYCKFNGMVFESDDDVFDDGVKAGEVQGETLTCDNGEKKTTDINLKAGDIVEIKNAYFKKDNGLFFVAHCPGEAGWDGRYYSLVKICKNGKISTAKYNLAEWPLSCCMNNWAKKREADAWNEEHATIEVVKGISTEYVIAYFEEKANEFQEQYEYYSTCWGEYSESAILEKKVAEHCASVAKRMSATRNSQQEQEAKQIEVTENARPQKPQEAKGSRIYYPISEDVARRAKEANSFYEYKEGSATAEYQHYCDAAYDILEKIKVKKPDQAERAKKKVDYYCRKLAEYYNDFYRNEASCPSIMICGGSNFPTRKKERQNSRRETLRNTWKYLENYLQKIENILFCDQPIRSGDKDAIEKLTEKIKKLEEEHKMHMDCNRYYRENGTLKGFDGLEEKEAVEIESFVKRTAYAPFFTGNETANIRRYKKRLERLIKEKKAGKVQWKETDEEKDGLFFVVENKEIMRLQILFDGIPPALARDILKSNGFHWSPKNKAWQRQLTDNARYAYKSIEADLKSAMLK